MIPGPTFWRSLAVVSAVILVWFPAVALGAPYGAGSYSNCPYASDCRTTGTTVVSVPPTSKTTITGYTINLQDGQTISGSSYTIVAKLIDAADASLVNRVEFYIEGQLVDTVSTADASGAYSYDWELATTPGTRLRVILYDHQGNTLPQDITISRTGTASASPTASATPQPSVTASSSPWLPLAIGAGLLVLLGLVVLIIRRIRHKSASNSASIV